MTQKLSTPDAVALVWFGFFNSAVLLAFAYDKWRARRAAWRVPEATLLLLGALGGWPGGWLGMKLFRHKTAKRSFQWKFFLALLPFAAEVWLWFHWR